MYELAGFPGENKTLIAVTKAVTDQICDKLIGTLVTFYIGYEYQYKYIRYSVWVT